MMLLLWRPTPIKQRLYRIHTRATKQGEFLIFPYAYRRGGFGYIMGKTMKNRLEAPIGDNNDWLFIAGFLFLLIAGWLMQSLLLAIPAVAAVIGWRYYTYYRYDQRLKSLASKVRIAPFKMTKQRYDMEFALQFEERSLKLALLASFIVGTISITTLFASFGNGNAWAMISGGVGIVSACVVAFNVNNLMQHRKRALSLGVVAGEIFDLPIPKPPRHVAEATPPTP